MKSNIYVVVLAGGSGTRFWPSSRAEKPKQFLALTGQRTLLQQTLARVASKAKGDRVYIVTNKRFKKLIAAQTAGFGLPARNILFEPSGKNTAPAIVWAASLIHRRDPKAVMIVLPSDHLVADEKAYADVLDQAVRLANDNYLVTLGIVPTRPETGYGYIKGRRLTKNGRTMYEVEQFVEKPDLPTAQKYLRTKQYFWNSGMFIWSTEAILKEFETHLPNLHAAFADAPSQANVERFWPALEAISIDYGVMEKAKRVAVVPADIGWSDVGSWEALWDVSAQSGEHNVLKGDVIVEDTRHSLVVGGQRLVAVVGLEDVVVVDTPDVLLVCRKSASQMVKTVVDALKKQKRKEL